MLLTGGQIANIEKARALGKRKFKTIRMSPKQIEKNRSYQGGYLNISNKDEQDDDDDDAGISPSFNACDDGVYLFKNRHCMREILFKIMVYIYKNILVIFYMMYQTMGCI